MIFFKTFPRALSDVSEPQSTGGFLKSGRSPLKRSVQEKHEVVVISDVDKPLSAPKQSNNLFFSSNNQVLILIFSEKHSNVVSKKGFNQSLRQSSLPVKRKVIKKRGSDFVSCSSSKFLKGV